MIGLGGYHGMEKRGWRSIVCVTVMMALAVAIQVLAMSFPEWIVMNANAGVQLNAHLGLFQTSYHLNGLHDNESYTWCEIISGGYSTDKCWAWRISQVTAITSVGLAHTAFILLFLISLTVLRPSITEKTLQWAWTFSIVAGIGSLASTAAWAIIMISLSQQHKKLNDGYVVQSGMSLYAMTCVGAFYITSSFWRMIFYRCYMVNKKKQRSRSSATLATVPEDRELPQ